MLNPSSAFMLAALPSILIYTDHAVAGRFYVMPNAPRIARDAAGLPLISLLLYGRGQGSQRKLMGGMFTLTTDLALTAAEQSLLVESLKVHLVETGAPCTTPNEQLTPEVMNPEWLDGTVQVQLTSTLSVSGTPSLLGDNRCTLSLNLNAENAQSLQKAWEEGLPDATVTYQGHVPAAQQDQSTTSLGESYRKSEQPGQQFQHTTQIDLSFDRTTTIHHPLTLNGPLLLSAQERSERLQVVNL